MELSDPIGPPYFCHQIKLNGSVLPPTPVTRWSVLFYEVALLVRITRKLNLVDISVKRRLRFRLQVIL